MRRAKRDAHAILAATACVAVAVGGPLGCAETADPEPLDVDLRLPPAAVAPKMNAAPAAPALDGQFVPTRETALALAHLQGHVEAALYLHREGAPGNVASGYITRGLDSHTAAMSRQFERMGLNRILLLTTAEWIMQAEPEMEASGPIPKLNDHLQSLVDTAQGNPLVQIRDLVDRIAALYAAAVEGEAVVAPEPYYEAFGYATVAFDRASTIKGDAGDALRNELNDLLNLWPGMTRSDDAPAPADAVREQLNRVRDVLRYAR